MIVDCTPLIRGILRDESLTRGLGDIEARMLVDWVTDWAELLIEASQCESDAQSMTARLFRRGKAIAHFVLLWCDFHPRSRGCALQLAASERFNWPLPTDSIEPPDLMKQILTWESEHR
ncbi:hypothetical protein BH11PLA2_BH11PLA2_41330 [soil metagenome]